MSRVAKSNITIPASVQVTVAANELSLKGPKGTITRNFNPLVSIIFDDKSKTLSFKPASADPKAWAQAGTVRAVSNNMLKGVTEGFSVTLELVGVGYRAQAAGNKLNLSLGFSHPIEYALPSGITAETPNNTTIIIKGIEKQQVGQVAAEVRSFRAPEPYKGKGVRYAGEHISLKETKKK
jgi:large subunit ribosomal protein L6